MDVVNSLPQADAIAATVAAVVALSLALRAALGTTVMYLTEAIKAAYPVRDGSGGLIALSISMMLGAVLGLLAAMLNATELNSSVSVFVLIGLFAGLFVASGAVESYKASAMVNVDKSAAIVEARKADEFSAKMDAEEAAEKAKAAKVLADKNDPLPPIRPPVKIVPASPPAAREADKPEGDFGSAVGANQRAVGLIAPAPTQPTGGGCDITP